MIKDITDLEVYQETMRLLPKLYELLRKLPVGEKDLEFQAKRAAKSVSANLAEGFAKRFIMIAIGSNDEVISHLRTLSIVTPRLSQESDILLEEYKILSKRINTLHKNWCFAGTPNH